MEIDVAVIGGGIAGLCCGWEAMERGRSVRVFEPGNIGGLIRTARVQGYVVEQGPNVFLGKSHFLGVLERLGLTVEIARPVITKYRQYVWNGTRPVSVPRDPIALMKSPLASWGEKIRLLRGVSSRQALRTAEEDESIQTFLGRALGDRIVREVVDTSLKGIFGGTVEQLSARALFPGLWQAAQRSSSLIQYSREKRVAMGGAPEILTLRGGNETLPHRLGERLGDAVVRAAVDEVRRERNHFVVSSGDGQEFKARAVVLACPGDSAGRLVRSIDDGVARALASVRRAPLVVVHLAVPHSGGVLPEKGFGVLFPRGEPSHLLGVMFNSVLFPHQAPSGGRLLTVCIGGVGGERVLEEEEGRLFDRVVSLIERRLDLSGVTPLLCTRWAEAIPQYEVGHWRVLDAIAAMERQHPGLFFIGAERGGIGVPDRVAEALRIAQEVAC